MGDDAPDALGFFFFFGLCGARLSKDRLAVYLCACVCAQMAVFTFARVKKEIGVLCRGEKRSEDKNEEGHRK